MGRRYASLYNIIWVQGGDYNVPDEDLVRAIAGEADPSALQTAHNSAETAALDYWYGEPWLAVNNVYIHGSVATAALNQCEHGGDLPFFLMESAYENEHEADEQRVRMQAYQAILSGASGQIFGNNPMWYFDGPLAHGAEGQPSLEKQLFSGALSRPKCHQTHFMPPQGLPQGCDTIRPPYRQLSRGSLYRRDCQLLVMSMGPSHLEL